LKTFSSIYPRAERSLGQLEMSEGTVFALQIHYFVVLYSSTLEILMDQNQTMNRKPESSLSLETIIALGLFGWLTISVILMGFGIW
jgi:hypothetical protein